MEAFVLYLFKSVIWLSGFALVYFLFLRNERFFMLNRLYLVSGILVSFFFPLITIHYNIEIPEIAKIEAGNVVLTGILYAGHGNLYYAELFLLTLYLSGVLFVFFRIVKQSTSVFNSIKKAGIIESHPVKLIRNADYSFSFSFFSYVFVNPSVTELETKEIVNHELVHIRQKHWVDLVLVELLCILQWFNPLTWIYIRFIRQNHEYIADEVALQRTSDPAIYRATLLNQLAGYPVISLANSFNYSLNKKRFKMMKNIVSSPWRKLKIFLILPVFAIVLYAFAKPEYSYNSVKGSPETKNPALTIQDQVVKGTVVQEDGTPLPGASVVVKGTTLGTTTDLNGSFVLDKLPSDAELIVSFIGFQSKIIKAGKNSSEMKITMNRRIVNIEEVKIVPPPPPPPPPLPGSNEKVSKVEEKKSTDKVAFIVVEEMPSFPGGYTALSEWISSNMKYPAEAAKNNISGQVSVDFIVTWQGKIKDVRVNQPGNPLLDAEAVRVISNMPAWNPGKQGGKQVPVNMRIPINFSNEKIPVNTNHK